MHDVKVTKTIQRPNIEAFHKLKKVKDKDAFQRLTSILYFVIFVVV